MNVFIQLTSAGTNTGPFNLYSDVDGYTTAFETNISRNSLLGGYFSVLVPDDASIIRIISTGDNCTSYVDISIDALLTTTTTTTIYTPTTTTTSTSFTTTTSTTTLFPPTTTTTTTGIIMHEITIMGHPSEPTIDSADVYYSIDSGPDILLNNLGTNLCALIGIISVPDGAILHLGVLTPGMDCVPFTVAETTGICPAGHIDSCGTVNTCGGYTTFFPIVASYSMALTADCTGGTYHTCITTTTTTTLPVQRMVVGRALSGNSEIDAESLCTLAYNDVLVDAYTVAVVYFRSASVIPVVSNILYIDNICTIPFVSSDGTWWEAVTNWNSNTIYDYAIQISAGGVVLSVTSCISLTTTTTIPPTTTTTTTGYCVEISELLGYSFVSGNDACAAEGNTYYGNDSDFSLSTTISASSSCLVTLAGYYSNGTIWKHTTDGSNFIDQGTCTTTTTTTIPIYHVEMCVNSTTYDKPNEANIPYILAPLLVHTPTKADYNYLFFSIPIARSFTIKDSLGADVTSTFAIDTGSGASGVDIRGGYYNNYFYRSNSVYATSFSLDFTLTLS